MKTSRLNKEIVIECAMELVDESGINGLRLNKIAERLEVKSPSLYTHTGSITELRHTVVGRAMEEFRAQLVDALLGRANLCAFVELGKSWVTYAKKKNDFYIVFYQKEYIETYERKISHFLRAAFERIFFTCELTDKELVQVERVITNYFRGNTNDFVESFDEEDLISDLEILYNGILQNFTKIAQ